MLCEVLSGGARTSRQPGHFQTYKDREAGHQVQTLKESRQAEHRQQPRSTTKCRVIPIVVSGQSTARLGQLCYETAENADPRP